MSKLTVEESQSYYDLLTRKRDELVQSSLQRKAITENFESTRKGDFGDQSSDFNKVTTEIRLKQTDAKLLRAVEEALLRLKNGNFGVCVQCAQKIASGRLQAVPWTRQCIACKEKETSGNGNR